MQTLPCTYGGPGLAIVGNVVYRLDATLRHGESYAQGDIRGEGDDAVVVQHHDVAVAPDVFALLFAPLAAVADEGISYDEDISNDAWDVSEDSRGKGCSLCTDDAEPLYGVVGVTYWSDGYYGPCPGCAPDFDGR